MNYPFVLYVLVIQNLNLFIILFSDHLPANLILLPSASSVAYLLLDYSI